MRPPRSATIRGKRHEVITERCDGLYVKPRAKEGVLYLGGAVGPFNTLETAVHEALHAAFPKLPERIVTVVAKDIARLLWRLGYRRAS